MVTSNALQELYCCSRLAKGDIMPLGYAQQQPPHDVGAEAPPVPFIDPRGSPFHSRIPKFKLCLRSQPLLDFVLQHGQGHCAIFNHHLVKVFDIKALF